MPILILIELAKGQDAMGCDYNNMKFRITVVSILAAGIL